MKKKTAGIITMHKVMNYGSVLQAYALQQAITNLGYNTEIIDYTYPNNFHLKNQPKKSLSYKIAKFGFGIMRKILFSVLYQGDKKSKINSFSKHYLNLSSKTYDTVESIQLNPPEYDVYITGSDQVWNPTFTLADDIFMLSFVDDSRKKVAYAPSVTMRNIPKEYRDVFKNNLSQYASLSVRDKYSADDLTKLLNRPVSTVCDPVLLLSQKDYEPIISDSKLKIKEKYVLLYILDYMFNPYPEIVSIIKNIREQFNYPVYFIWGKKKHSLDCGADKYIPVPSVCDFLYLIKNAEMVITTSFHGTAFSLIFRKQFLSIVNNSDKDSRIGDLLNQVGLGNYCKDIKSKIDKYDPIDYEKVGDDIEKYINESRKFLEGSFER